jgi:hypothetical protein
MELSENRRNQGRFTKGTSGNPAGRPPKVREARALLENSASALVQRCIDAALNPQDSAHAVALKLTVERLVTIPKTLTYLDGGLDVPEVATAADLPEALLAIVRGVVSGAIPLDTLAPLTGLLVGAHEAGVIRGIEERLAALEAVQRERGKRLSSNGSA